MTDHTIDLTSPSVRETTGRLWKRTLVHIRAHPAMTVSVLYILIAILAGLWAPVPYDPLTPNVRQMLEPPSSAHWFGTDSSGFDVFSRTVAAGGRDLPLALVGTALSMFLGVPLGLLASRKGRAGEGIMRGLDAFQAFPLLIVAVVLVTITGNRLENVIIAIAVINVPRFIRLVRSEALTLREMRFIEAAVTIGASRRRILFRHILPNVIGLTIVQASLAAAHAIIVIAALSFLGIGVSPPNPSWGAMIQDGARIISNGQWWVVTFPGLTVFGAVLAMNTIADGLETIVD